MHFVECKVDRIKTESRTLENHPINLDFVISYRPGQKELSKNKRIYAIAFNVLEQKEEHMWWFEDRQSMLDTYRNLNKYIRTWNKGKV